MPYQPPFQDLARCARWPHLHSLRLRGDIEGPQCHLEANTKLRRRSSSSLAHPRAPNSPSGVRARPPQNFKNEVLAPRHKWGLHRGAQEAPRTPCRVGTCRSSRLGRHGRVSALSGLAGARRALQFEGKRSGPASLRLLRGRPPRGPARRLRFPDGPCGCEGGPCKT